MASTVSIFKIIWQGILVFSAVIFAVFLFAYLKNNYTPKNDASLTPAQNKNFTKEKNPDDKNKLILEVTRKDIEKTKYFGKINCDDFEDNIIVGKIFDFINRDRQSKNLKSYAWNEKLCESAKLKIEDMAKNNYFEHISPASVTYSTFIDKIGYKYSFVGENLAMNATTAEIAHMGFMDSPGHYKNIMSSDFSEIGIAYGWGEIDDQEAFFIVQHFGAPISKTKTICTDKKNVEDNIEKMEKQKIKIADDIKNANDIYERFKEAKKDTQEVKDYIAGLEKDLAELEKYLGINKEYLAKCDN